MLFHTILTSKIDPRVVKSVVIAGKDLAEIQGALLSTYDSTYSIGTVREVKDRQSAYDLQLRLGVRGIDLEVVSEDRPAENPYIRTPRRAVVPETRNEYTPAVVVVPEVTSVDSAVEEDVSVKEVISDE